MTLLVLDIKVPELADSVSSSAFAAALLDEAPSFFSWLISFAILCRLWITQHALLAAGKQRSRAFAGVNFVFLGAVSFIPFPTALVSEHPEQVLSVWIFSACYAVAGLALGGMWFLLDEQLHQEQHNSAGLDRTARRVILAFPVAALVASLLACLKPELGIAVWVLLPLLGISLRFHESTSGT